MTPRYNANSTKTAPVTWQRQSSLPSQSSPSTEGSHEAYQCTVCKDAGWLYASDEKGEALVRQNRTQLVRCGCRRAEDARQRAHGLQGMDGLTAAERALRFHTLGDYGNQAAAQAVEAGVRRGHGLITLLGKPGVGKSRLLICAVNAAREAGVPAIYVTVTDLLAYLRAAFDPKRDADSLSAPRAGGGLGALSFEHRWQLLLEAQVLALDELDEFSATSWAMEQFLRLIDERWRAMDQRLTLCASNRRLPALPEKVISRLRDGRAQIYDLEGPDLRLYQRW